MLLATLFAPVLVGTAALARARLLLRRSPRRPRIFFGTTPVINVRYWAEAVRQHGYDAQTVVYDPYAINRPSDFDVVLERRGASRFLRPYVAFGRAVNRFDVFCVFFDGGLLSQTPLERLEWVLLKLAGRRIVAMPYGSDIAVSEWLGPYRQPVLDTYPQLIAAEANIRRRVDQLCRHAHVVIRNVQPGYLPRWDILWITQLGIDVERWAECEPGSAAGRGEEVVVAHAANHRKIKGTDEIVDAVERLKGEGLDVRLELFEGRPNEEVRDGFAAADIVVEQLLAGYGMTAVEAMSLGKPVVSRISWLPEDVRTDRAIRESPIVDAGIEDIGERLRELVEDPRRRASLGHRSRQYVLHFHSYDAVGRVWDAIFRHVLEGAPLPASASELAAPSPVGAPAPA